MSNTENQNPLMITEPCPKFDKTYSNNDINTFKDDILQFFAERDKYIVNLINTYQEKITKTENNYKDLTCRISNNYSDILSSQAKINNRLDKLNSYDSFVNKTNDQLISHEIRINNMREDYTKSVQKYDKIYLDNLELPGYIGKFAKYKNCQVFFDDVIKELSKLNQYKEKNIVDLKSYKDKLENIIKNINILIENNNKSQIKYINDMSDKSLNECKSMLEVLNERIIDMRIENSRYAVELIGKSLNLTKEWDKIQDIKKEITTEINEKIDNYRIITNTTVNNFNEFKKEFIAIKKKFVELAEFIKDVRFRKNLGNNINKKEIKNIVKKIKGKKKCSSASKEKLEEALALNFKENSDIEIHNTLRESQSHSPELKIKNYIKGITKADEFKKDSRIHNHEHHHNIDLNLNLNKNKNKQIINKNNNNKNKNEEQIIKKNNDEFSKRNNKKMNTVVCGVNNLRKLQVTNNDIKDTKDTGTKEFNVFTSENSVISENKTIDNNRYLFKDVEVDANDKIINELASELEQTNNKKEKKEKYNEENSNNNNIINNNKNNNDKKEKNLIKGDNCFNKLLNKIEPLNINMNINKIENLSVNNNTQKNNKQNLINDSNEINKKMNDFDKKIVELEVYTKEKIIDLIAQIENLRLIFLNTVNNKTNFNKLISVDINNNINNNHRSLSPHNSNNNLNNKKEKQTVIREPHIVEIGAKILPPPKNIPKKFPNNNINNNFKSNINNNIAVAINNGIKESNLPHEISQRIKTGKPTSIKTIINRTIGINNTTFLNNMANDINNKFLKGIEKKMIIESKAKNAKSQINLFDTGNNITNGNKFIELNKITNNIPAKTQMAFKNEINLLASDNTNLP